MQLYPLHPQFQGHQQKIFQEEGNGKKGRKIARLSLYLLYLYHV